MGSTSHDEGRQVFGAKEASRMTQELRASFISGKTRSYEWRRSQLKNLLKVADYHEQEIVEALRSDLSKPEFESYIQELRKMMNRSLTVTADH